MDAFELNKILGAVLATCLFLQALNLLAGTIFQEQPPAKPGYEIAVKEEALPAGGAAAPKTPAQPIGQGLANADVDGGNSASRVCAACHTFEKGGPNRVRPSLWGVVDRPRASQAGYYYSVAV